MDDKDKEYYRNLYTLASVGINIVAATFIGLGMGWLIDNKLFSGWTRPWGTLVFLIFGIIAGFRNVFSMVRESGHSEKSDDAGDDGASSYNAEGDSDDDKDKD